MGGSLRAEGPAAPLGRADRKRRYELKSFLQVFRTGRPGVGRLLPFIEIPLLVVLVVSNIGVGSGPPFRVIIDGRSGFRRWLGFWRRRLGAATGFLHAFAEHFQLDGFARAF